LEPSSAKSRPGFITHLDRIALASLGLGLAFYVMPFWPEGRLRIAFWLTLLSTLLHVYTSHRSYTSPESEKQGARGTDG
jgi:hypothetical protein